MLKWPVTYKNFNGETRQQDLFFYLSKTEIADLVSNDEIDPDKIQEAVDSDNKKEIYNFLIKLLRASYGKKSEDGEHFRKSPAILRDLIDSPAYDALITDILSDENKASKFIVGIFPEKLLEEAISTSKGNTPKFTVETPTNRQPKYSDLSKDELVELIERMKRGETEGAKTSSEGLRTV